MLALNGRPYIKIVYFSHTQEYVCNIPIIFELCIIDKNCLLSNYDALIVSVLNFFAGINNYSFTYYKNIDNYSIQNNPMITLHFFIDYFCFIPNILM